MVRERTKSPESLEITLTNCSQKRYEQRTFGHAKLFCKAHLRNDCLGVSQTRVIDAQMACQGWGDWVMPGTLGEGGSTSTCLGKPMLTDCRLAEV